MYKSKKDRQKEAKARQAAHNALTTNEKLDKLDRNLGTCEGARKERARLHAEL